MTHTAPYTVGHYVCEGMVILVFHIQCSTVDQLKIMNYVTTTLGTIILGKINFKPTVFSAFSVP